MKLSEKGIETIFSALLKTIEERDLVFRQISQGVFKKHIEALEFEPDDFQDCVTATPLEHYNLRVNIWNALGVLNVAIPQIKEAARIAEEIAQQNGCNCEPDELFMEDEND